MIWQEQPLVMDWRKIKSGRLLACYCPFVNGHLAFGCVERRDGENVVYTFYELLESEKLENKEKSFQCRLGDILAFNFKLNTTRKVDKVLLRKLWKQVETIDK